jgi:hypothetical protein
MWTVEISLEGNETTTVTVPYEGPDQETGDVYSLAFQQLRENGYDLDNRFASITSITLGGE